MITYGANQTNSGFVGFYTTHLDQVLMVNEQILVKFVIKIVKFNSQ